MKIAVVGAGVAGLTCAYNLCANHKVYVFEKSNRPGGGVFSIKYKEGNLDCYVDLGFSIYNRAHYPNLVNLLDKLQIRSQDVPKDIIINHPSSKLYWRFGDNAQSFTSTLSYLKPINYKVFALWGKWEKQWKNFLEKKDMKISLTEYLKEEGVSPEVQNKFVLPLIQSFWCGLRSNLDEMPAYFFFSYLGKIGLLEDDENSQWRVIRGGGFRIISQMVAGLINPIRFQTEIVKISRFPNSVEIITHKGEKETFDAVILAIPADKALKLLEKPTPSEEQILSSFVYEDFDVVVHTDERFIQTPDTNPASWYIQVSDTPAKVPPVVTWNLNHLQRLPLKTNLFLTFATQGNNVPKEKTITIFRRRAVKPTWKMLSVQKRFSEINGPNRTYFCGDYWGTGTLEDTITSALDVLPLIEIQDSRTKTL